MRKPPCVLTLADSVNEAESAHFETVGLAKILHRERVRIRSLVAFIGVNLRQGRIERARVISVTEGATLRLVAAIKLLTFLGKAVLVWGDGEGDPSFLIRPCVVL